MLNFYRGSLTILIDRNGLTGAIDHIRLFLTNESGYYLDISLYKEVTDIRSGQVRH